jgi:hypothetical protein
MRTSQLAAMTFLTCAGLALSSCTVKGGRGDFVVSAVAMAKYTPPAPPVLGSCACPTPPATETDNILYSTFLSPCIQVENRLANNGDGKIRLNTNDLIIDQIQISYESTTSVPLNAPPQTIGVAGFVPAAGKVTLGATLVPTTLVLPTGQAVRIRFYFDGHLLDGTKVKTAEYEYIAIHSPGAAGDNCNY